MKKSIQILSYKCSQASRICLKIFRYYVTSRDENGKPTNARYIESILKGLFGKSARDRPSLYHALGDVLGVQREFMMDESRAVNSLLKGKYKEPQKLGKDFFDKQGHMKTYWYNQGGKKDWFEYIRDALAPKDKEMGFPNGGQIKQW